MLNAVWQYIKAKLCKGNRESEDNKYLFNQVNEMIKEYRLRTKGY